MPLSLQPLTDTTELEVMDCCIAEGWLWGS